MSHSSAGSSRCDTNPGRSASSSRRADTPAAPLGPAASTTLRAAAGRSASCSGCSRPLASTPTTASVLGSLSMRPSKMLAAFPASGASPGIVTMASLASSTARRRPATRAAAGPPPPGSSEVKTTGRVTSRGAPTTMTVVTWSGSEASTWSSSGSPSNRSASLSGRKRRDAPPARTTAVTRRNKGWLLVRVRAIVFWRLFAALLAGAVDTSGLLGGLGSTPDNLH